MLGYSSLRPADKEKQYAQKLAGKIAVITGGSSGIGLATAKQFVSEGAYVFITGRRQSELNAAVKEIGQNVTGIRVLETFAASITGSRNECPANSGLDIDCRGMNRIRADGGSPFAARRS